MVNPIINTILCAEEQFSRDLKVFATLNLGLADAALRSHKVDTWAREPSTEQGPPASARAVPSGT
jgi:hypothetical protein